LGRVGEFQVSGKLQPEFVKQIDWCSLGRVTQRLRISMSWRVGRITSTAWIRAISASTLRGSSPNPAAAHIWPSAFHST
jgi:hypothetical protein